MGEIRIGRVSAIDYANGMVSVVYTDRDASVTKSLPYLSFNGEYKMPAVGKYVLVAHLSNGSDAGIVLGPYWNKGNVPATSGQGVYRKELGSTPGEAYIEYSGGELTFKDSGGTLSLSEIRAGLGGGE